MLDGADNLVNRLKRGVNRTVAGADGFKLLPVQFQPDDGGRSRHVGGMHREPHQLVAVHLSIVCRGGVGDDGENVLVGDVLLLVAEDFELLEAARKLFVRQLVPHFLQPRGESVLAGVLAQHDVVHADADGFGRENLVGLLVRQNTVLVDAAFAGRR